MRYPEHRGALRRIAAVVVRSASAVFTRKSWTGLANVPRTGGVVIACNHVSVVDHFSIGPFLYSAGRFPRFLGKASVFEVPVVGRLLLRLGQVPVHRGTERATAALDASVAAASEGACLVIYPEATVTRDPRSWPMTGKTGAVRIALEADVPLVPAAVWGGQDVWPYHGRPRPIPRKLVRVTAGPPVDLSPYRQRSGDPAAMHEATDVLMRAITELVASLRGEPAPAKLYDRSAGADE